MQMTAKANIIIDTRRKKQNDVYPVKLRVTFERKQKYYPTGFDLTETKFKKVMFGERKSDAEKQQQATIQAFEGKAIDIIKNLRVFTWLAFEKEYHTNKGAKDTISFSFESYVKELRETGRIGTAVSYESTLSSLNKFCEGAKFADVTPSFLKRYEKAILDKGNTITTVGIYMRTIRAIINSAINEGTITKDYYPFGKNKYEIPMANNIKKALTLNDISAIYYHEVEKDSTAAISKDYWLFMYLCNGMNMKDLCLLKYENIKGNVLEFIRAKTVRTKRKIEPIRVALVDDVKAIIERRGNVKKDGQTYIFPILTKGLTPERERDLIQLKTSLVNDHMKNIAQALHIDSNVTTYAARHSFATILQRSGAAISFISEALGHGNVQTTQNYLGGFEDDSKAETVKALTAFKVEKPKTHLKAVS